MGFRSNLKPKYDILKLVGAIFVPYVSVSHDSVWTIHFELFSLRLFQSQIFAEPFTNVITS